MARSRIKIHKVATTAAARGRRSRSSNKESTKERPITLASVQASLSRRLQRGDSFHSRLRARYDSTIHAGAKFTRPRSSTIAANSTTCFNGR